VLVDLARMVESVQPRRQDIIAPVLMATLALNVASTGTVGVI